MKRTWMAPLLALLVCGGVGWIAGRSGSCPSCLSQLFTAIRGPRPAPVASIPEQTPVYTAVSDGEAQLRVEQLIGHKLLDEIPQIANPFTPDEVHAMEPPLAKTIVSQEDDAAPTVMPATKNPGLNITDRFDLWLLLCVPSPLIVDDVETEEELGDFFKLESDIAPSLAMRNASERKTRKRENASRNVERIIHHVARRPSMPVDDGQCTPNPSIDSLEFRPSDAKAADSDAFQRRSW